MNRIFLGEIFASILTLYMGNGNQRLPTDEEVVMCDGRTTAEEVWTAKLLRLNSFERL